MFLSVFGHFNLDFIIKVEKIPDEGSIPVKGTISRAGGTGRNIAFVSSLLGIDVELFSRVGEGFPSKFINELEMIGVSTKNVKIIKNYGMTPVCFIVSDGEKQIAFIDQGPMNEIIPYDNVPEGEWVHFSTGIPEEYIKIKSKCKSKISFDPGQEIHYRYDRKNFDEMISDTEIFFANTIEFQKALNFMGLEDMLKRTKNIVITRGSEGCMLINKNVKIELPAYRVVAKETVGAGDSFRAGFYAGMMLNFDLIKSCLLGMKIASLTVSEGKIIENFPPLEELIKSL